MRLLKISVAGVRGIVGEGMSAELAIAFAQAFATYLEAGTVVIGRDSRSSGPMMRAAVLAGLLSAGCRVIDLDVAPSPSIRLYMRRLQAAGGIIVAAGHNPEQWNALKFLRSDGGYLNALQGEELLEIYNHAEFVKVGWDNMHPLVHDGGALDHHRRCLVESFDVEAIRRRRFRVAIDCCNGVCALIAPALLTEIGCDVVSLNDEPGRPFPRPPNPTPDNLSQLAALVRASKADVGFGFDAEGERMGIITERAVRLHQERTFAIAVRVALLRDQRPARKIVTNLSTSNIIDLLAREHDAIVHRTAIGQAYVAESALRLRADIAGEGSGQVIFPWLHPGSDSLATMIFLLEHLARSGKTVSQLDSELPELFMIKENVTLPPNQLYRRLQQFRVEVERRQGEDYSIDLTDGVRIDEGDTWVHVRASTTESQLRIIAEGPSEEAARRLHLWARELIF